MTTLDHRLYAWLLETDERRFEAAFGEYFAVAYPALIGRMARISKWDTSQLEELAQEVLFKFFERVGRERREASSSLEKALTAIRPIELGPRHAHTVNEWTRDTAAYRVSAMNFQLPQQGSAEFEWRVAIRSLAAQIPQLQTRGWHLIESVRVRVLASSEQAPSSAEGLAVEIIEKTELGLGVEKCVPGAVRFVECTFIVIGAIPRLQVPTNAFLFEISDTVYLDECKKRGRQKRGGKALDKGMVASLHPLELLSVDPEVGVDGDDFTPTPGSADLSRKIDMTSCDPTADYEDAEFLERFYDYLRVPVDEAEAAYEHARARGLAIAELRRLNSLSNKFSRTISVLSMLGEGYTQEQVAQCLSISRNQVKYAVEKLQQAFAEFAANSFVPAKSSAVQEA